MHVGVQGVARRLAAPAAVLATLAAPTAALAAHRAPRTTILSGPAPRVAMRTVTFTFTANAARGVRYSWRVDGHRWSRFTNRTYATLKHLRAGTHVFQVRARSGRAVARRATRAAFVVDLTPPQTTFAGANRAAVVTGRSVGFRFHSSATKPMYECSLDRARYDACASPLVLTGLASGRHRLAVRSVDPAGNADPTPAVRFFAADAAAPAGSLFSDDFETGNLSRWAVTTGGDGTATAQGAVVQAGSFAGRFSESAASGSVAYGRASLAAGIPDLSVTADLRVDAEGAAGSSVPLLRLFDATGTRVVNLYRQNGSGKIWVQHSGIYASTTATLPLSTWAHVGVRAGTGAGTSVVQVTVNGTVAYSTSTGSLGTAGAKTVQIGNEAKAQPGIVDVDNVVIANASTDTTPPDTTITSAPSGTVQGGDASVAFTASEAGAAFQCSLDGAAFASCTSPQAYTGLGSGTHTFQVRAVDAAGNVDPTPATATWSATGAPKAAILIADNQNRRILITDYNGTVLWKFDNPTGETSAYSGPLGVRWMANGHILATFGTGKVGEIDPATKTFLWKTAGFNSDWFQSPYDAQILPDGNLAVATAKNEGGRIAVYNRATGAAVWKFLINYPHLVEYVPAGSGTNTSKPTLLMAGFSPLTEAVYDPGQPGDKTVVWRWNAGTNTHRAILDGDGRSIVLSDWDNLVKVARPTQTITWSRFQGNCCNGEVRGIGISQTTPGYVVGYRIWNGASQIRFTDANGNLTRSWSSLSDGTRLNLVWGLRTMTYPG